MKPPAQAMERLRRIVGPKGWSTDDAANAPYLEDWRRLHNGRTAMVLRPKTSDEVRRIMRCAAEFEIPVVPQGGNTGLVGGGIPDGSGDQILLSLERLKGVRDIDPLNYTMSVNAGVTLKEVQDLALEHDRFFPLSIGSEGSAQIGGVVSTNAGGISVLKYGSMRDLVLGLEVVLPDGTIWDGLNNLRKNNTGYDLKQLFIGAEGTLGIVTAATLKLFPAPKKRQTALAAVPSPQAAVELLSLAREASGDLISSFELIPRIAFDLVFKHVPATNDPLVQSYPWYVLLEASSSQETADLRSFCETLLTDGLEHQLVLDGTVATSDWQAENLWRMRHAISEAERAEGTSIKHDISVPISSIAAFLEEASAATLAKCPDLRVVAFGHIGDGNIHFNLQQPEDDDGSFKSRWGEMNTIVHDIVIKHHGSISAEHGIGTLKRDILAQVQPQNALMMKQIKALFDPNAILNPGKLIN